jgi:hypothetical protein
MRERRAVSRQGSAKCALNLSFGAESRREL